MSRELTPQEIAERSLIKTYRKTLWNPFIAAVKRYELVRPGDRIAVCISGGKDSMVLAKLMQELLRHTDRPFQLEFLVMDPGYNAANRALIEENARTLGIPITVFESDIFDVTVQVEKNPCYLCARMRRGHLYIKAKELGCENTHFANPHGFHDPDHYTTPYDITLFMKAAMEYDLFQKIVTSPNYTIPATNLSEQRTVRNTNALTSNWTYTGYLYTPGTGGKTGSTDEAGKCLVETAKKGDTYLISVVMGEPETITLADGSEKVAQFYDTIQLLNWGFENFQRTVISEDSEVVAKVNVTLSTQSDQVMVRPSGSIARTLPKDVKVDEMEKVINLFNDTVEAPVEQGQVLGTMVLKYQGEEYGTLDLIADSSVERSELLYRLDRIQKFFQNWWVKLLLVIVVVAVVALLLRIFVFSKRRRYAGAGASRRGRYSGRRRR